MKRPLAKLGSTTAFVALALVLSTAAAGNGQAVTALADLSGRRGVQAEQQQEPSAQLWTFLSEAARHLNDGGLAPAMADLGRFIDLCSQPIAHIAQPHGGVAVHVPLFALPQLSHLPPPVALI